MTLHRSPRNHPQQPVTDAVDCRETPADFWDALHREHGFTIDVAANASNAKLARYFDRAVDGLAQSWAGEVAWCNPPYSACGAWVGKAIAETGVGGRCVKVVMLLPANRTEQPWWQDMIEPVRDRGLGVSTRFIRGRLRFVGAAVAPGAITPNENRPPFGVVLVIFERQLSLVKS